MLEHSLTIGQLARETGAKPQTIRYYEEIGLLARPPRTAGNQRRYGPRDAERLSFIRHSRDLGFSLEAIRQLLSLADDPERSCEAADLIASAQLEQVRSRIARLASLELELERMLSQCRGELIADCRVIEVLADHGKCFSDSHGVIKQP